MCTGVELALAGTALLGTGVAAYGQVQQGQEQKDWSNYQAAQTEADGRAAAAAARVQADQMRRAGARQRAAARADLAASGVDVGEGSAVQIDRQMTTDVEHDAILTTLDGQARAANAYGEGAALRVRGRQAARAGYINAGATALQSATSLYRAGYGGSGSYSGSSGYSESSGNKK